MTTLAPTLPEEMPLATLSWPEPLSTSDEHPAITAGRVALNEMLGGEEPTTLEGWRAVVGEIDFAMASLMAARTMATAQISPLKADQELPSVDLSQERVVINRMDAVARELGIDSRAVSGLMIALIGTAKRQHDAARSSNAA